MAEFQAVILAGDLEGSDAMFYPLVESAKCLLPLCNRPLLYYSLRLLERAGFTEVIVACDEKQKKFFVDFVYKGAIKVDFVPIVAGPDDASLGTAETLVLLRSRLKTDFFVLAGDLITEASLHELADTFRTRDATVAVMFKEYDIAAEEKASKGAYFSRAAAHADAVTTFVGLTDAAEKTRARVALLKPPFFSDRVDGGLAVSRALLEAIPNMTVHTNLTDCHVYIFKRWVLDLIDEKKFVSLRNDVLPYLVSVQVNLEYSKNEICVLFSKMLTSAYFYLKQISTNAIDKLNWGLLCGSLRNQSKPWPIK